MAFRHGRPEIERQRLPDLLTIGSSIRACKTFLLFTGARQVLPVVLGKTVGTILLIAHVPLPPTPPATLRRCPQITGANDIGASVFACNQSANQRPALSWTSLLGREHILAVVYEPLEPNWEVLARYGQNS